MNHKPLITNRYRVKDPIGIKDMMPHQLKGFWHVVIPENSRDVVYLQLLGEHQRFANYCGDGVLVHENAIPLSQN